MVQNEDMFNLRILALIFLLTGNLACQSSRLRSFDKLLLGQEKDTVLEVMGGPTYHERIQGQDRWTYILYESDIRHEKVVYFLDGFLTYRGLPIPPIISAEEQDSINAEKNLKLSLKEQIEYQKEAKGRNSNPSTTQLKTNIESQNH
jgi:outer membrane protein assembly factor BamE